MKAGLFKGNVSILSEIALKPHRPCYRKYMMNEKDYRVFSLFASSVRKKFPTARIWAFGSRVYATFTEDSDLDVCVVTDTLNETIDLSVMEIAWQVGFEHDLLISTITYSHEEFEHGPCSKSSLIHTILEQGVAA